MANIIIVTVILRMSAILCADYKDVVIKQGPVRGFKPDDEGVFSFYGIPYATAPTGEDRFKDALPPPNWTKVFNATNKNIACPQWEDEYGERRLDCLVANIFVPAHAKEENLPVIVYIHGGAFQYGVGTQMLPTNGLVQRGIVFVNFNYRLGAHGFLCLNTEFAPGNAGAKDQVLAMKWVKDNIARFGGNPHDITIGGSSAGAFFVDLHIVSAMSSGLFTKAIAEGGNGFNMETIKGKPELVAKKFANEFGVKTNGDITKLEDFYRSMSNGQLNAYYAEEHGFRPCIENHNISSTEVFLNDLPINILRKGHHNKVIYMTGFTSNEGIMFLKRYKTAIKNIKQMSKNFTNFLLSDIPYKTKQNFNKIESYLKTLYFPVTPQSYLDYKSDSVFSYWAYVSARYQSMYKETYIYYFTYNDSLKLKGTSDLLARHGLPSLPGHIPYSLYLYLYYKREIYENMTSEDYRIQQKLQKLYYNFCKYGKPTIAEDHLLDWVRWLPVTPKTPHYLEVGNQLTSKQFPLAERFNIWDMIYGFDYLPPSLSQNEFPPPPSATIT